MDLRSGAGKMTYSNGDVYDGIWHRDMVSELTNMDDILTVTVSVTG